MQVVFYAACYLIFREPTNSFFVIFVVQILVYSYVNVSSLLYLVQYIHDEIDLVLHEIHMGNPFRPSAAILSLCWISLCLIIFESLIQAPMFLIIFWSWRPYVAMVVVVIRILIAFFFIPFTAFWCVFFKQTTSVANILATMIFMFSATSGLVVPLSHMPSDISFARFLNPIFPAIQMLLAAIDKDFDREPYIYRDVDSQVGGSSDSLRDMMDSLMFNEFPDGVRAFILTVSLGGIFWILTTYVVRHTVKGLVGDPAQMFSHLERKQSTTSNPIETPAIPIAEMQARKRRESEQRTAHEVKRVEMVAAVSGENAPPMLSSVTHLLIE